MSNRFGDSSFSDLLHTPFSQLHNPQPAEKKELSFVVYDLEKGMRPKETLMLDSRIDDEAHVIFNTYAATLQQVFSSEMNRADDIPLLQVSKSSYDYSLLVTPLSRIWELELNNSVVQMIRQENGIEMPQYYKRVKSDKNKNEEYVVSFGNKTFNLNKSLRGDELMPQTFGEVCLLMEMYSRQLSARLNVSSEEFKTFKKKMDIMKQCRNKASHSFVVQEDDFYAFYANFCSLIRDNWLTVIMDGKDLVRS